jgi:uncharacterized surface protein with fasciclin (FAS1) repeats
MPTVPKELNLTGQRLDIVDTAVSAGTFPTLVAALTTAGQVDTLKSAGPFTVFAPSDEAFAALPAGTVEDLVRPENNEKLTATLLLHVVPGQVLATDRAGRLMDAVTPGGETVSVEGIHGVTVDVTKVMTPDIACTNGIIHVIDAVIMPKD